MKRAVWESKKLVYLSLKAITVGTSSSSGEGDYGERIGMCVTHIERVIFIESTNICIRSLDLTFHLWPCIFITCFLASLLSQSLKQFHKQRERKPKNSYFIYDEGHLRLEVINRWRSNHAVTRVSLRTLRLNSWWRSLTRIVLIR